MNITSAKQIIKNTIEIYREKDKYGNHIISQHEQRPIFLLGAPGIGKTAIMEQISQELDIPLVSYSLTHHTRQSVLGLPYIKKTEYEGKEYSISEYTMSEIIASIYDVMKKTGRKEGILFIDEVNCVSETLFPSMLQFLQYKTFGKFKVPEDWIIVTAGNPTEFNDSAKELDVVIMDRLKKVEITPQYTAWKDYAINNDTHPAILAFLEIHKDYFYKVDSTIDGKQLVTARGWSDLSLMMKAYEKHGFPITEDLIGQYVQYEKIAKVFTEFYKIYISYKKKYNAEDIINNKYDTSIINAARKAEFDERYSLISILLARLNADFDSFYFERSIKLEVKAALEEILSKKKKTDASFIVLFNEATHKYYALSKNKGVGDTISQEDKVIYSAVSTELSDYASELDATNTVEDCVKIIRNKFKTDVKKVKDHAEKIQKYLKNSFDFIYQVFNEDNEMIIFLSELSIKLTSSVFIALYGSPEYNKFAKLLNFKTRISSVIDSLVELEEH